MDMDQPRVRGVLGFFKNGLVGFQGGFVFEVFGLKQAVRYVFENEEFFEGRVEVADGGEVFEGVFEALFFEVEEGEVVVGVTVSRMILYLLDQTILILEIALLNLYSPDQIFLIRVQSSVRGVLHG